MDPDKKKEDNPNEFGKVIDALHNKNKLPSLRTYQGDVAEFIKEKNESVISVAVKEKKREEEKEEKEEKLEPLKKPSSTGAGFQVNFTMVVLSLLLVVGGATAAFYVYKTLGKEPVTEAVFEEEIIPYSSSVTLANVTNDTLGLELRKLSFSDGINIVKISDTSGNQIKTAKDLFSFLNIAIPDSLERTLEDKYVIGVFSQNKENSYFLVIKIDDFGRAFSAMLDWEGTILKDLSFLSNIEINTNANVSNNISVNIPASSTTSITSTVSSSTTNVPKQTKPVAEGVFIWKDVIIKNKDTRGLVNEKGKSKIAYTFLDKNTILITDNISVIGDVSSTYNSRSVAR